MNSLQIWAASTAALQWAQEREELQVMCSPPLPVRELKATGRAGAACKKELCLGSDLKPQNTHVLQCYYHHFSVSVEVTHGRTWSWCCTDLRCQADPTAQGWTQPCSAAWVSASLEAQNKMETTYKHVGKCHSKGEKLLMIQYVILLCGFLVSPGCCALT